MGSDRSRSVYRGLAYHDPRLTEIWRAQSTFTEAGACAGDPEPQQDTAMVLEASGEQLDGSTLRIRALRGGLPGPGPMRAGSVYRLDDSSDWRGWEVPTTALGWEAVTWDDGTGSGARATYTPKAVTLADGTILVAVEVVWHVGSTSYQVRVYRRDPDTRIWSSVAVYTQDADWTDSAHPCLVVLPSGRVLCYHWVEDLVEEEAQVRCHASDDSGATWVEAKNYVLADPVDISGVPGAAAAGYELGRLRAAAKDGQVSLVAALVANDTDPVYRATLRQWASTDDGMSFDTVSASWDTSLRGAGYHEVLAVESGFMLVYLSAVDLMPTACVIGHVREDFEDAPDVDVDSTSEVWGVLDGASQYFTDGDLAACLDEDGAIYVYGRQPTVMNHGIAVRSIDGGATWSGMGHSPYTSGLSAWWYTNDASTHPRDFSATCQRGRVLLAHNWDANPGNEDNSLGALYLGGYTSVTLPGYKLMPTDLDRVAWVWTWLPFDLPGDCGWTAAGAGTEALAAGALNIVTAANQRSFSRTATGTIAEGLLVRVALETVSGGALGADDIHLRLRLADGVDDYDVSIRFAATGFRVYDNNGAAAIGSETVDTTGGIEVLVAFSGDSIQTWYRVRDTSEDHLWEVGPSSAALVSDVATPEANHLVNFGHGLASTAESNWFEVHYCHDEWTGYISALAEGWTNPDDLAPRNLSADPLYVADGCFVAAKDGPAVDGNEWDIDAAHTYAIERILDPDPRVTWRSTSDAAAVYIALALDQVLLATAESKAGNDLLCLGLFGINFKSATLQGYDVDTAAWVTIASVSAAFGMTGMHWTRVGNTIVPANTSGSSTPYLYFNEMEGGTFRPDTTTKPRRISWHTEGRFGGVTVAKNPTLVLDGVDGTEGASGTDGEIWAPSVVVVAKLNGATYAGYRLYIPIQDTVDGFFEIGRLLLGPVAIFGLDYSWGRAIETTPGTETSETPDRRRRSRVRYMPPRTIEFGWADGVDTTDTHEDTTPDYLLASTGGGALPIASVYDVPELAEGLLRLLRGPDGQVVYLPAVTKAGSTLTFTRREEAVLATIESPLRIEVVQGDERSTELVRVATVALAETTPRGWR